MYPGVHCILCLVVDCIVFVVAWYALLWARIIHVVDRLHGFMVKMKSVILVSKSSLWFIYNSCLESNHVSQLRHRRNKYHTFSKCYNHISHQLHFAFIKFNIHTVLTRRSHSKSHLHICLTLDCKLWKLMDPQIVSCIYMVSQLGNYQCPNI